MSSKKQKIPKKVSEQTRSVSREKGIYVSEDSLQTKPPGAGPGSRQSASLGLGERFGASGEGVRGGIGAQQSGWSSRQQADRLQARAEEARFGQPLHSGYGGMQQNQMAGAEESSSGPDRSMQSAEPHGSKQQQLKGGGNWPQPPQSKKGNKRSKR